jgi:phosphate-selective porin
MMALRQAVTRHAELGVRYDDYNPDQDAVDRQGARLVTKNASFATLSVAAAWCSLPYLRVTLQYDHRSNPLGRSRSGKPTTLAMDSLTVRAQVDF